MITYLTGDATDPQTPGTKVIAHVCNDEGKWGRGFVLSVSKRWSEPEADYREWSALTQPYDGPTQPFTLGQTRLVHCYGDIYVANMIAQHGRYAKDDGTPPIRYGALEECLTELRRLAIWNHATVHMPRIGCGLAGGKWSEIEPIIERTLPDIEVYIYDFDTKDARTVPWTK
jgi:O-acetyl-ADP-ribose deacetylase (regulator of RNase III)